jgi:rhodanese-related sulfurtransferase
MLPLETSVDDVKRRWAAGEIKLLDCRELLEYDTARLEGATLIPMREIPTRLQEVETLAGEAQALVVYCHHGVRSMNVANWLRQQGVENVQSMAGGIDYWSLTVDHTIPRY